MTESTSPTPTRKRTGWIWIAAILAALSLAVGANAWNDYQQQRNADRMVETLCPDC